MVDENRKTQIEEPSREEAPEPPMDDEEDYNLPFTD